MSRFHRAAFVLAVAIAAAPVNFATAQEAPARPRTTPAQAPPPAQAAQVQPPVVVYQNPESARDVQGQLREILNKYPPSLREVLRNDPSLLGRPDYLAPYPLLVQFLQQHPEVARNPTFFFGEASFREDYSPRRQALDIFRNIMEGLTFLTGFLVVVTFIYSLLRQALEYRKWRRQIQIQTDVHTKLVDRLSSNQELLAYMESAAGRRFLELTPSIQVAAAPNLFAPVARILWSVQIGIVVAAVGVGCWLARATVSDPDILNVFEVMGTMAIAVGVGFVVSAVASWVLSQRLGLVQTSRAES
jgi:hypothetical protein